MFRVFVCENVRYWFTYVSENTADVYMVSYDGNALKECISVVPGTYIFDHLLLKILDDFYVLFTKENNFSLAFIFIYNL